MELLSLEAYQFHLPSHLIAQRPVEPRDQSRLMVVDRDSGRITECLFKEIFSYLEAGDQLVMNNTKVVPCRLLGRRDGGGRAEVFLLKPRGEACWEALAKPGKKLKVGSKITFAQDFACEVVEQLPDGRKLVSFLSERDLWDCIDAYGVMPLPPYIKRESSDAVDKQSYQTVFAKERGAVAAPTAGLHFTPELLADLAQKQVEREEITLHVGLGTFQPVQVKDIRQHTMHREQFIISASAAHRLNQRPSEGRQICVGTTTCRALESVANCYGEIREGSYETEIFIYPGYQFRYVKSLLTNFHLPGSTLLMLVSAFAGYELMREAYELAVKREFRFFSYGDAMLIL